MTGHIVAKVAAYLLGGRFAKFQLPDDVLSWGAIPMTGTGKMDKKRVREMLREHSAGLVRVVAGLKTKQAVFMFSVRWSKKAKQKLPGSTRSECIHFRKSIKFIKSCTTRLHQFRARPRVYRH